MRHNKGFLYQGTEVITDEFRIAHVDAYHSEGYVTVRYHSPPWPFPEWDTKTRKQLTVVKPDYEEALM